MNRIRCLLIALCAAVFFYPLVVTSQEKLSADDLARGKRLYVAQCAVCHGIEGVGGRGTALNQPNLRRVSNVTSVVFIIRNGILGTDMPAIWNLGDDESRLIAEYVLTLGKREDVKLPGDAAKGKAIFDAQGCASCHIINGVGGSKGPMLTEIGAMRGAAFLREAIVNPAANVEERWLVVTATKRDGQTVRGIRVNEDSFTIQMRDTANRFHSFRKADLKDLKKEPGVSAMPGYKSLSATELDDLVAYLASLRGGDK